MQTETRAALVDKLTDILDKSIEERRDLTDAEETEWLSTRKAIKMLDQSAAQQPDPATLKPADDPPLPTMRPKRLNAAQVLLGMIAYSAGEKGVDIGAARELDAEVRRRNPSKVFQGAAMPLGLLFKAPMSTLSGGNAESTAGIQNLDGLFFSVDDAILLPTIASSLGVGTVVAQEATARIPKLTGTVSASWVARDDDLPDSDAAFDAVEVSPKTVGCIVTVKRSALLYGLHPNVQSIIPGEMQRAMGVTLDQAVLYGTGTDEPVGVGPVAQVGADLDSLADAYSIAGVLSAYQKSDVGLKWALANETVGKLSTTVAFSGAVIPAMQGNTLAGYPVVTNFGAHTDSGMNREYFVANWSYAHLVVWDSASLVSNPYSGFASGSIDVRIIADANVLVRDPKRFYRGFATALGAA